MHIFALSSQYQPPCHPPTRTNLDLINVRRNIHMLQDLLSHFYAHCYCHCQTCQQLNSHAGLYSVTYLQLLFVPFSQTGVMTRHQPLHHRHLVLHFVLAQQGHQAVEVSRRCDSYTTSLLKEGHAQQNGCSLSPSTPPLGCFLSHPKSFYKKVCQFNSDFHPPSLQMVGIACIDV